MKAEKPAEGILRNNDWGDAKMYSVSCECGQPDHEQKVWVEAEDTGVSVNVWVMVKSPWWKWNRYRQIWQLLTRGYLEHEATLAMTQQQALNYAETLKSAIKDVEEFRKNQNVKN